jgi:hypothetical protein
MFILALHFSDWSRCFRDKSAENNGKHVARGTVRANLLDALVSRSAVHHLASGVVGQCPLPIQNGDFVRCPHASTVRPFLSHWGRSVNVRVKRSAARDSVILGLEFHERQGSDRPQYGNVASPEAAAAKNLKRGLLPFCYPTIRYCAILANTATVTDSRKCLIFRTIRYCSTLLDMGDLDG